jgi:hypothetical protein
VQAFAEMRGGLCFILIVRAQHAFEAEKGYRENKAPSRQEKNPTTGIQAELLLHVKPP